MIKLNRNVVPVPPELDGDQAIGALEKARIIEHYKDYSEGKSKSFEFEAYKSAGVRAALRRISHEKCAYCESLYAITGRMHVEHYRPKNGVIIGDKLVKPGYYWLAADWENLLPSCNNCNTRNWEDVNGELRIVGKGNYFPLVDESKRASSMGEEDNEEPLLLNPFIHRSEDHLVFTDEGFVKPAENEQGIISLLAKHSIDIYGLQRRHLINARHEQIKQVLADIKVLDLLHRQLSTTDDPDEVLAAIKEQMRILDERKEDCKPYAGAIRQVLSRHYQRLFGIRETINK